MCGCGLWGHVLGVALAVLGEWLNSKILEMFSNLKNSMILNIQIILPNLNCHTNVYTHVIFVLFLKSSSAQLTVAWHR